MTPDDPRHGTSAGYIAGCRGQCCWQAKQRYDKQRRWELHTTGQYRKVPSIGAVRRVQALQALGWSVPQIGKRADIHHQHLYNLHRHPTIYTSTFAAVVKAYDALSMRVPPESTRGERISAVRARNHAKRNGWAPPLAWDDIDNDDAPTGIGFRASTATGTWRNQAADVDEVVVARILAGDWRLPCTAAEKAAVVAAWEGSHNELARRTGWKVERYTERPEEVA